MIFPRRTISSLGLPWLVLSAWLLLAGTVCADNGGWIETAPRPVPGILEIGDTRQAFLDDRAIHEASMISRFVLRPEKYAGNPVLGPDKPWEQGTQVFPEGATAFSGIQITGQSVLYDDEEQIFKMWYLPHVSWPDKSQHGRRPWCYAISKDGYHWEKPNLGLYEYQGSTKNNIIADWGDPCYFNVIKDLQDPDPQRRYKALGELEGPVANRTGGVAIAFSPDGLRWTQYAGNPVVRHGRNIGDAPTILGWAPSKRRYIGYFRPGHPLAPEINGSGDHRHIRSYGYAESEDFIHWSPTEFMMAPDRKDLVDSQYMQFTAGIDGEFYIGFNAVHQTHEQTWDIFLMTSRDAFHWNWANRHVPYIPRGEIGSYDAGYMTPSGPIFHDGKVWIFYGAYSGAHSFNPTRLGSHSRMSIALCTLPQNRWIGLLAGPSLGTVVTRPVVFKGSRLFVDLDASVPDQKPRNPPHFDECEVRAALTDQSGAPISGFELGRSTVLTRSEEQELSWTGADLSKLAGKPVRIRFELRNAALYSFQFR